MLMKLCKELIKFKKIAEVRVICRHFKLNIDEVDLSEHIEQDQKLHDQIFNTDGNNDFKFGPLSNPKNKYLKLPEEVKYTFIDAEVVDFDKKLKQLYQQPIIGLDVEWRPIFFYG